MVWLLELQDLWIMPDSFTSMLLAALNESAEVNEGDWRALEAVLRGRTDVNVSSSLGPLPSENRFAATVSFCMAKIRSGS